MVVLEKSSIQLFALLNLGAKPHPFHPFPYDKELLVFLNNLGSAEYDGIWHWITSWGNWYPLFLVMFMLLVFQTGWRQTLLRGLVIALAALATNAMASLSKTVFERVRPGNDETIAPYIRVLKDTSDYSFFSAHAAISFAILTIFIRILHGNRWKFLFLIWPLLFSYSRIYLGLHFPSDIIVGAIFGSLMGIIFHKTANTLVSNRKA